MPTQRSARPVLARTAPSGRLEGSVPETTLLEALQEAPVGLVLFDPSLRVTRVNAAFCRLTGRPPEAHLGRPLPEALPQVSPALGDVLRAMVEGGPPGEGDPLRAGPWQLHPFSLRDADGEVTGGGCLVEGPPGEGDAEVRLRLLLEAGARLSSPGEPAAALQGLATLLVPTLGDWCAVDLLSPAGTLLRVAAAHVDPGRVPLLRELGTFHALAVDAPGSPWRALRSGAVDWQEALPDAELSAAARGEAHLRALRALGPTSWLAVPLPARSGPLGVLCLGRLGAVPRPPTEDVRLVEELAWRAALALEGAALAHRARAAEAQAEQDRRALARTTAELDQFAYVASHDLRAPLRGISNLSQWLEEDLSGQVSEQGRHFLQLLRSRVHRLDTLVEGILQYSRAGRIRSAPERVEVAALLAEVVARLAPPPEARVEVAPGMPVLHTERAPLQQVFLHLVGNALKHAGRPGVRVQVVAREEGESYEFSVTDDGPGIAPEFHERIWSVFQTLQARDKVEGTGIGLSVVRKLVECRGGRAWVESTPGAGATFRFTWPRGDERRG